MSKKGSIIVTALTIASVFAIIIGSALSSTVSQSGLQKRVLLNMQARQVVASVMQVSMAALKARIDNGEAVDGKNISIDPPSTSLYGPTSYGLSSNDADLVQTRLVDAAQGAEIEIIVPDAVLDKNRYNSSTVSNTYSNAQNSIYREGESMIRGGETLGALRNIDVYMRAKVNLGGLAVESRMKQTLANRVYTSARIFGVISYPDVELISNRGDTLKFPLYCMGDLYLYPSGPNTYIEDTFVAGNLFRKPIYPKDNLTSSPVFGKKFRSFTGTTALNVEFDLTLDSSSTNWHDKVLEKFGGSIKDRSHDVKYLPLEGFVQKYVPARGQAQRLNPYYAILQPTEKVNGSFEKDPLFEQKVASHAGCFFRVSDSGQITFHVYNEGMTGTKDITSSLAPGIIGTAKEDYSSIEVSGAIEEYKEEGEHSEVQALVNFIAALPGLVQQTTQGNSGKTTYTVTPQISQDMMEIVQNVPTPLGMDGLSASNNYQISTNQDIEYPKIKKMLGVGLRNSGSMNYSNFLFNGLIEELNTFAQTQEGYDEVTSSPGGNINGNYVEKGLYDTRQEKPMSLVSIDVEAFRQAIANNTFGPDFDRDKHFTGIIYVELPTSSLARADGVKVATTSTIGLQLINCKYYSRIGTWQANGMNVTTASSLGMRAIATNGPMYVVGAVNDDLTETATLSYLIADSLTLLSKSWTHESRRHSKMSLEIPEALSARQADNTILRTNIIAGIVPTSFDSFNDRIYSGGMPGGIVRSLENWSEKKVSIHGSLICLYESEVHRRLLSRFSDVAIGNETYKYLGSLPQFLFYGGTGAVGNYDIFPTFHSFRNTSMRSVSESEFNNL